MKKRLIVFLPAIVFLTMFVNAQTPLNPEDCFFSSDLITRGDVDGDGSIQITDPIAILQYLFVGGPQPHCIRNADTNDNGGVDLSDAIVLLNFLFQDG